MTEMVLLLSKGASATALDAKVESGQLDPADFNVTMQYWLDMARSLKPVNEDTMEKYRAFDLVGMPELEFGCIGERIAVRIIYDAVLGVRFCATPAAFFARLISIMSISTFLNKLQISLGSSAWIRLLIPSR